MPAPLYNPGEPVWDMTTGEPYIDPETGDAVEARPGLRITLPDGRILDGDDVVNAIYWRTNLFEGEVQRARGEGVPYQRVIFEAGTSVSLATTLLAGEAQKVNGVGALLGTRLLGYDARARSVVFACILKKRGGEVQQAAVVVNG